MVCAALAPLTMSLAAAAAYLTGVSSGAVLDHVHVRFYITVGVCVRGGGTTFFWGINKLKHLA